jgi:hypothetical protein
MRHGTELGLQAALADVRCKSHITPTEERPRMLDGMAYELMHPHSDGQAFPMVEHTPTTHDPERAWVRGARLFRCTACDEEIVVSPSRDEAAPPPEERD